MAEREMYAPLVNGANAEGWALWRLVDGPGLPERPADICGKAPGGQAVLVEAKEVERFAGVGKLTFEASQVRWLREYARDGGLALVAVKVLGGRVWLVQVMGQGGGSGAGESGGGGGGLVAITAAQELKMVMGRYMGWNAAMEQWKAQSDRTVWGG